MTSPPQHFTSFLTITTTSTSLSQFDSSPDMEKIYMFFAVALVAGLTGGIHSDNIQEKRVKRGDTVILPCDITMTTGSLINWFRNCSHSYQPRLIISPTISLSRFSFQKRDKTEFYDLQIKDITASDQGTYYCANVEKKKGSEDYKYGTNITRVSLIDTDECEKLNNTPTDCSACAQPMIPAPLTVCVQCWMMLYSVCAVCCLLFVILITICLSHVCLNTRVHHKEDKFYSQGSKFKVCGFRMEHQCLSSLRGEPCLHTEVVYRLLDSSHTSLNQ